MDAPARTSQHVAARQPRNVDVSANTATISQNTTVTAERGRRSRRLAGEVADLEVWPPQGTPDQRPRRANNRRSDQQDHPPPPSADFTFTYTHPEIPTPGFPSFLTGNMTSRQSDAHATSQPSSRQFRVLPHPADATASGVAGPLGITSATTPPQAFDLGGIALRPSGQSEAWNVPAPVPSAPPGGDATAASYFDLAPRLGRGAFNMQSLNAMASPFSNSAAPTEAGGARHALAVQPAAPIPFDPLPQLPVEQPKEHSAANDVPKCIICCDPKLDMTQPCSRCAGFWCFECIKENFEGALRDTMSMPARCCAIIQLPIILPYLSKEQADTYRAKFEEWMAGTRTYCPVPTCSTFIPDRFLIPPMTSAPTYWEVLKPCLYPIFKTLEASDYSKYFRTITSPRDNELPDFYRVVRKPLFLDAMQRKLDSYATLKHFMADFNLLLSNARRFENIAPTVSKAGMRLGDLFYQELERLKVELPPEAATSLPKNACFACPKCSIAICAQCKQKAHPSQDCDPTIKDEEAAIIAKFGYKKCPKCAHGVKRMFGCNHIHCRCGAHFCYNCGKLVDICEGEGCGPGEYTTDEDESVSEVMAEGEWAFGELEGVTTEQRAPDEADPSQRSRPVRSDRPLPLDRVHQPAAGHDHDADNLSRAGIARLAVTDKIQNTQVEWDLDDGGEPRWGGEDMFGDEPDDPHVPDNVWACEHSFWAHEIKSSQVDNGYPLKLECNRCFSEIYAKRLQEENRKDGTPYKKKRANPKIQKGKGATTESTAMSTSDLEEDTEKKWRAWDCEYCTLVVCVDCKGHYISHKRAEEHTGSRMHS